MDSAQTTVEPAPGKEKLDNATLVLVGAGHAHLTSITRIPQFVAQGHSVVVVGPSRFHYYSGMGPGIISSTYEPRQIRFNVKRLTEDMGGTFIEGSLASIDTANKTLTLTDGREQQYDVASLNIGSKVYPVPGQDDDTVAQQGSSSASGPDAGGKPGVRSFTVKPIEELLYCRRYIVEWLRVHPFQSIRVAVVGGGFAGVEVVGNLLTLSSQHAGRVQVSQYCRSGMLRGYRGKIRALTRKSLEQRGAVIYENVRVMSTASGLLVSDSREEGCCWGDDGRTHASAIPPALEVPFEVIVSATGVHVNPVIKDSGLPVGADGGMSVNDLLQSTASDVLYGGGDCIHYTPHPLPKAGVYAVRQNSILAENLLSSCERLCGRPRPMQRFSHGGAYLVGLNLGDHTGVTWKWRFVTSGRLAFRLKNALDVSFMKKFQLSGELEDVDEGAAV